MRRIVVARAMIGDTRIEDLPTPDIADGEILLAIEKFALTANNVTYAAIGEVMKYWDFFPAAAGEGVVPVWGYARVVASKMPGFAIGERIYGYLPMATHLVVAPGAVKPAGFVDTAPHRAHLAAVYNAYRRLDADPGHDPKHEGARMVFEPLFMTGWLIEAMFARADWHGAQALVVTSASSKTCLALIHVARAQAPHIARIGLTSAGNVAFVEATGLYDVVLPYERIDDLPKGRAVAVDFAGNGAVLRAVHAALGDALAYSALVGLTHWEGRAGAGEMAGPKPVLFFAPDHVSATVAELGGDGFARAVAASWTAFIRDSADMVQICEIAGLEAGAAAFEALVAGTARADVATVVRV